MFLLLKIVAVAIDPDLFKKLMSDKKQCFGLGVLFMLGKLETQLLKAECIQFAHNKQHVSGQQLPEEYLSFYNIREKASSLSQIPDSSAISENIKGFWEAEVKNSGFTGLIVMSLQTGESLSRHVIALRSTNNGAVLIWNPGSTNAENGNPAFHRRSNESGAFETVKNQLLEVNLKNPIKSLQYLTYQST